MTLDPMTAVLGAGTMTQAGDERRTDACFLVGVSSHGARTTLEG